MAPTVESAIHEGRLLASAPISVKVLVLVMVLVLMLVLMTADAGMLTRFGKMLVATVIMIRVAGMIVVV